MIKCQYCEKILLNIRVEPVDLDAPKGQKLKGAVYTCQFCNAVLSVGLDPLLVIDEIAAKVANRLRK